MSNAVGSSPLKVPLFVALDVDDRESALKIATQVKDYVGGFKIGPRLTYKYGESLTRELAQIAPVFVDNKYHDIPSTVTAAIQATFNSGASFATIHASHGREALQQFAKLESELSNTRYFKILAVTVLTSFSEQTLPSNWSKKDIPTHVSHLADEVIAAGLTGLVCSPEEVQILRKKYHSAFLLTPGIRLPTDAKGDQKRVMGPREAISSGSSALVVGRPIVEAKDPKAAAKQFFDSLRETHS